MVRSVLYLRIRADQGDTTTGRDTTRLTHPLHTRP